MDAVINNRIDDEVGGTDDGELARVVDPARSAQAWMTREPRYCGKDRSEDALGRRWVALGNVFACVLEAIERRPLP